MELGAINKEQYVGELLNFSISTDNWWAPSLNGIHYGNGVLNLFADHQAYAVVDTGTSMLCLPKVYFSLMMANWRASLPSTIPLDCSMGVCITSTHCDKVMNMVKSITFQIGDTMLEMKPQSYLMDAADLDERFSGSCIFGVIQTPDIVGDTQLFILGDVFLRHFYSVYDYENSQVLLAVNKHSVGKVDIYHHD